MTAHNPILPAKAIDHIKGVGLDCSHAVLADFAAAGLVKSYALVRESIPVGGTPETVRDGAVPAEMWDRIIEDGKTEEAMAGGTVRLAGSDLIGGAPAVRLTGIRFSEGSLLKVLARYQATPALAPKAPPKAAAPKPADPPTAPMPAPVPLKDAIPPGAVAISVKQAMQALGIGRTKTNDLMNDGTLVRRKSGRRTLITVESVNRLLD
uniref:Putative DNA binding, helix-turn-helix domain containing protein n=2 Tax=viral metagenome TaxID=1070528 RepID=A0A6H1ZRP5_9ZZZZ